MNLHSTTRHLKHSSNLEYVENVRSSNVFKFEFELRLTSLIYLLTFVGMMDGSAALWRL